MIFNRSHYEDVVAVRVRKLAARRGVAAPLRADPRVREDARRTRARRSSRSSCTCRATSSATRLQERLDDPEKRWKFRAGDLDDRAQWDEFAAAYEDALRETSTDWAPWYVVPADHNWSRNLAVAEILVAALEQLDPKVPKPEPGVEKMRIN